MYPRTIAAVLLLPLAAALSAQAPSSGLTRLLESQAARFPARADIYVKHLGTGKEAAVRGDESFSSASVIKLMIDAFQIVDGVRPRPASPAALPQYDRTVLLESTSETSANVSIGDVNGDGNADIVLAKGRHWPLVDRVLLGDGRGGFPTAYDLGTTSDRSYSGHLVDLDGDGDLDVVISNDQPDPKLVYLNDGMGRYRLGSTYGQAEWPTRNATVVDLNADGLPDIVVANRAGDRPGANYICFNKGRGQFDAACEKFSTESATTITASDVNGDGLVDLVVPHRDGGQSHVYVNGGKGKFADSARVPFGPPKANIRMSAATDLNGDGRQDLVTIDEQTGVAVYFGEAGNRLSAAVPIGLGDKSPYALALNDLDGDGTTDIVVGYIEARPAVFFNDGSGRRFTPVLFGDDKGTAYGFAIGDLDKDGRLDIAVARSEAPNVLYFGGAARLRDR